MVTLVENLVILQFISNINSDVVVRERAALKVILLRLVLKKEIVTSYSLL